MKRVCPECGKSAEWENITRLEDFAVKNEKIKVEVTLLRCPPCGAEFEDMNAENDPYNAAYEEYRRRKGMAHPAQITAFRKAYNLTQKEFSELMGFGGVTLSRYENGALQDDAHDQLLRFAMKPNNLLSLIRQKPNALPTRKREALIARLEKEITGDLLAQELGGKQPADIYSGNQTFNLEKTINLVKSFTYSGGVVKSKLLKLLFYADFLHFRKFGKSITGLRYAHLPYGPVPDQHDFLLGSIQKIDGEIQTNDQLIGPYSAEIYTSQTPPNANAFSDEEMMVIREVTEKFRHFNAREITEFSHAEKGYQETGTRELIPYGYARDLKIKGGA